MVYFNIYCYFDAKFTKNNNLNTNEQMAKLYLLIETKNKIKNKLKVTDTHIT